MMRRLFKFQARFTTKRRERLFMSEISFSSFQMKKWLAFAVLAAFGGNSFLAPLGAAETDIRRDAVVDAVQRVMPSVVNIATETIVPTRDPTNVRFRRTQWREE